MKNTKVLGYIKRGKIIMGNRHKGRKGEMVKLLDEMEKAAKRPWWRVFK